MAYSFADLKRNKNGLEKLSKAIENLSEKSSSGPDDRLWYPETDKSGNGMAIIRFLKAPLVDGEEGIPWVRMFAHGFQGPGGWYIENCLTTLKNNCPVCEHNSGLWNSGVESNKDVARKQKRKQTYYSNILVLSDPKNPDNEDKVFIFKYGPKIFAKLTEAMQPEFEDETPMDPFDFWTGANFKVKIRQVEGYRNYDKSEFESTSELFKGDDSKLEEIWKKEYSLKEFMNASNFKSYDKLKERLNLVLGMGENESFPAAARPAVQPAKTILEDIGASSTKSFDADSSDDEMDYFKSLAEE